jgi:RNA polymerase sigma-70 factor (ECF subfamily)
MSKFLASMSNLVDPSLEAELSDEKLLERYCSCGDRLAFAELVTRYERELYSYLRRYLNDAVLAEDAFQMTFLQVHLKCGQFDGERKFRPWLYTIATNQAIDAQRRNKRHRGISLDRPRANANNDDDLNALVDLLVSREHDPAKNFETARQAEWVRQAVDALPDPVRATLTLVYYQGLKYREAADVLGVPVGTVKSRIHAAILKLNEEWQAASSATTN